MSIINSFAVLGDEEEDVISTLIADAAAAVVPRPPLASVKKVEKAKAKVPVKPTHSGRGERGQGRGGRGRGPRRNGLDGNGSIQSQSRGRGSGRNGLDGNGSVQTQNKQADPYQRSYGGSNGYQRNYGGSNRYQNDNDGAGGNQRNYSGANGYQRNRGNGYQRNYGRDSNGNAVDERNQGSSGRGRVFNENHESQDSNQINTRSEQIKSEGQIGDGQIKSEGQIGDGQIKSEGQIGDGQIKSKEQNGDDEGWEQVNKYHGKGYGRGSQTFKDFENGNHSSGGDRRGYGGGSNGFRNREGRFNGRRQGLDNEKHEILNDNNEKEGDNSKEEKGDRCETEEGNHGNKEHEINDNDNTGGLEGKITVTHEGFSSAAPGKLTQERTKDADERKQAAAERRNQMTLDEYEKKLLEKRKNLPALQKAEGKRVVIDKEFESMQRIEKKKDGSSFIKLKAENDKLKRNGSLDKEEKVHKQMTLDEYEKKLLEKRKNLPALQKAEGKRVVIDKEFESMQRIEKKKDGSSFIKLKAENDKLKRNGSLDKEEKVHKATISIDEFIQPPRRRWLEERGRAAKAEEEIPAEPAVEVAAPPPPAPCIEDQSLFPVLGGGGAPKV